VKYGHHDAKKTVQQIVQKQQEKIQAICKAGHENHHPFEVEKQVWLPITKGRLKDAKQNRTYGDWKGEEVVSSLACRVI